MLDSKIIFSSPARLVLELNGQINRNTVPRLRKDYLKMVEQKVGRRVELDLTKAVFADLSSVAVMVEIHSAVLRSGGELKLAGVCENTEKMLSMLHLDRLLLGVPP